MSYVERAIQYASDVVLGHQPASRVTILACQRFLDDLKRSDKGKWEYSLDNKLANRVCSFVEKFPHVKGARGRINLLNWQCFVLVNIFGWVDEDGLRRFRTAYIEMPKKQGKSTFIAPLGLYCLCMDDEEGSEVYCAAVSRDQARIVHGIASQMARRTPEFLERFGVEVGAHAIMHADSGSTYQALSKEGKSLEGKNPHLALVDELHRHQTREVWDILDESREARDQSLIIAITNSGSDKSSICYEQRTYAIKVMEGYDDDSYFGLIYGIDPEDEKNWDSEEVWHKAQPSLGHSVHLSGVRRLAKKARAMPSARSSFMRYQLGVWAEGEHAWMPRVEWDRAKNPNINEESMAKQKCAIGLDLASKRDVAAMVAAFQVDGQIKILPRFYVPQARVADNDSYSGWEREGWLVATPGETIDFDLIEEDLVHWNEIFNVVHVPYDPWQATQLATHMVESKLPMVEFPQNARKLSEPMKEIERMVVDGELEHDGNPMMTWMIENVVVQPDRNDNIFPRKEREENKIDGAVAMVMAGAMFVTQPEKKPSKYTRGGNVTVI